MIFLTGRVKLSIQRKLVIITLLLILFAVTTFFAKEVSFTQDDRDRLIRLEVKVEEGLKAVNQRIDGLQQLIYILISVVVAQTIGVIGFVIWDRRTALQPVAKHAKELEEKQQKLDNL